MIVLVLAIFFFAGFGWVFPIWGLVWIVNAIFRTPTEARVFFDWGFLQSAFGFGTVFGFAAACFWFSPWIVAIVLWVYVIWSIISGCLVASGLR